MLVEGQASSIVAFAQTALSSNLFWSLGNYNGHKPEGDPRGTLTVQRFGADAGVVSMPALGLVSAFDMDQRADGRLVLGVATRPPKGGGEVVLLSSADDGHSWQPLATIPGLPEAIDQVAVRAGRDGGTHVAFALRDGGDKWIIKMVTLAGRP